MRQGSLVLYRGRTAVVAAVGKDKIEIRTESGDAKSVRPKDVELLHPGPAGALPPRTLPDPNEAELAELLDGETLPFEEFSRLAYGDFSPEAAYSAWLLLGRNLYFEGSVETGVTPRPAEAVLATLATLQAKADGKAAREALLERIRQGAILPEDRPGLREVEQVATGSAPTSKLLRDLGIEATPEKAHRLLLTLGVWEPFTNPFPERMKIDPLPPDLPWPAMPDEERADFTGEVSYAIDDEGSNDPDDAVGFSEGLLWVHVADPAAVVAPGSELDREAMTRGTSLYMPDRISPLLPAEATEVCGLGLQKTSPALSFGIRIDGEGLASLEKVTLSRIRAQRLTYDGAAALREEEPLRTIRAHLERFRERRRADGALFIQLPEVKIRAYNGEVTIRPTPITPERELVANAMLAAGAAAARWAVERDIPFPFVTQAPPETIPAGDSIPEMFALRRSCAPSSAGTTPGKHAGLGLEPYARVTSPLRRYADLLAHQQIRRFLAHAPLLSGEEIENKLLYSENAAGDRRKLERTANEFFLAHYLNQSPVNEFDAILVNQQDDRLTFLIPSLAFEYKNRFGGKIPLGSPCRLSLQSADPPSLTIRMRIE